MLLESEKTNLEISEFLFGYCRAAFDNHNFTLQKLSPFIGVGSEEPGAGGLRHPENLFAAIIHGICAAVE